MPALSAKNLKQLTIENSIIASFGNFSKYPASSGLQTLNLKASGLTSISSTDLAYLSGLQNLDLTQNNINYIDDNAFKNNIALL